MNHLKAFIWMLMGHLSHNFRVIFFRRAAKSSRRQMTNRSRDAANYKKKQKERKNDENTEGRGNHTIAKASILKDTSLSDISKV